MVSLMPITHIRRPVTIAGSSFYRNAGVVLTNMRAGTPLGLRREPQNKYDANAIQVVAYNKAKQVVCVGHVPRGLAAKLAPMMDADPEFTKNLTARKANVLAAVMIMEWDEDVPEAAPGETPLEVASGEVGTPAQPKREIDLGLE
jgi:hypothetical protein